MPAPVVVAMGTPAGGAGWQGLCVAKSPAPRLIVALALSLALFALLLGVAFPPSPPNAGAIVSEAGGGPQLLVSEFADRQSTLWLVDPKAPSDRHSFLQIDHAAGWEISGAVSPAGGPLAGPRLAFVVLEPGRQDAETEGSLYVSDGGPPRLLLEGVDLRGGVTWSQDGESILVREVRIDQRGVRSYSVVEVRVSDGRATRYQPDRAASDDLFNLHVVGRPSGGPLYAALIGRGGTKIVELGIEGAGADGAVRISMGLTREWALSPDGAELAFTEQNGLRMQVRTATLDGAERERPTMRAATKSAQALLDEAEIEASDLGGSGMGSASPLWGPDGALRVGVFRQAGSQAVSAGRGGRRVPCVERDECRSRQLRAAGGVVTRRALPGAALIRGQWARQDQSRVGDRDRQRSARRRGRRRGERDAHAARRTHADSGLVAVSSWL